MLRTAAFPARYVQGPGVIGQLGAESAAFAQRVYCLVDNTLPTGTVPMGGGDGAALFFSPTAPHCTESAIGNVVSAARREYADAVAALGGGKIIDLGRAAADDLGLPFVSVPTIAASDAPCSALAVIYDDEGRVVRDRIVRSNPRLVVVDSTVIANAPARYFSAGMGDALATFFEVEARRRSGASNLCGGRATHLAVAAARLCRDIILEQGAIALEECKLNTPGAAFETVLEANILLSGIGFESGGVAGAHAIHHGLADLPETHRALHGEKVAFGVMVELALNDADDAEIHKIARFNQSVDLPCTLAALGISNHDAAVPAIARRATRQGEIIHNEPFHVDQKTAEAAIRRADTIGNTVMEYQQ